MHKKKAIKDNTLIKLVVSIIIYISEIISLPKNSL